MKKIFFHKEVLLKRGQPTNNFFILLKGKAKVLNSNGSVSLRDIYPGEVFGLLDNLREKKWKNTVVSDSKSEVLFIPKDILIKNIFSSREYTSLTLNLLKMAS